MQGKLRNGELECSYGSLLTVGGSGQCLRYKTEKKYEMHAKEAKMVFTFANTAPEEKVTVSVVLIILTDQITTTF